MIIEKKEHRREYMRRYMERYRKDYPDRCRAWRNKNNRTSTAYWKERVINKFSKGTMECARCGFNDIRALTIDHIKAGGTQDRRNRRVTNPRMYYRLIIETGTPEEYQVLCMNCQFVKRFENKEHN